jgi:hypothetical protein
MTGDENVTLGLAGVRVRFTIFDSTWACKPIETVLLSVSYQREVLPIAKKVPSSRKPACDDGNFK